MTVRASMMDYQLTIDAIARRAETLAPDRPIVGYRPEQPAVDSTWRHTMQRARRLAAALQALGVRQGDPVASLMWNSIEHLEAYFGVPIMGGVLCPLNPRLRSRDLAAMLRESGARVLIADASFAELVDEVRGEAQLDHVIVAGGPGIESALSYDELIDRTAEDEPAVPAIDERDACMMCFTSGTTGAAKGVVYSHRALAIQSLVLMSADLHGVRESDTLLVVVPMFHANAWGHPYAAALAGASLVLPHRDLTPENLVSLIERHRVTLTGGVPTVWDGVLKLLDEDPGRHDLSSIRMLRFGGAQAPVDLLRGMEERHGIPVVQGFGMTEMSPQGGMAALTSAFDGADAELKWRQRAKQGRPVPFLEIRARGDDGFVPWDGKTTGELEVRGPSVAGGYLGGRGADTFTDDGWLRTGDLVTIDSAGFVEICDRAKDLIKSGGEWISSVALEMSLREHPGVVDAAVIGIADARWGERPLAVVVPADARPPTAEELRQHLAERHPRWWLPARFEFVPTLPRTAVGKVRKVELREQFGRSNERVDEEARG